MKEIRKCTKLNNSDWNMNLKNKGHTLFVDIETTGLSADKAIIYLAGAAYAEGSSLVIRQFFAESIEEEALVLQQFANLMGQSDALITFHGTRFDIPFLKKRMDKHNIDYVNLFPPESPSGTDPSGGPENIHTDLHQLFSSYKHVLNLENYKLKTLEKFLGIGRKDCYDGRELVKVYQTYCRTRDDGLFQILLTHNYEDLTGMAALLPLCALDDFFHGKFFPLTAKSASYTGLDGSAGQELLITCGLCAPLPVSISCNNDLYYLHMAKSEAVFRILLYEGTLKYFYPDYKNYYYLPDEDTAIHKSVAAYVDKSHRIKAKAATCYTKKSGIFAPWFKEEVTPAFYQNYKDPVSYLEVTESFMKNTGLQKIYCTHILNMLKSGK